MKRLLLSIGVLSLVVLGCGNTMQSHTSDKFSLEYPKNYSIESNEENVLSVSSTNGRLEIFDPEDFPLGRIHGYSSSGLNEFESELVPKEKKEKEELMTWFFYRENDEKTMKELKSIFKSIKLN